MGERPGQRVAVDLPGGAGGQLVHHREAGHERRGHPLAQQALGDLRVIAGVHGEIADQQLVAGLRGAHGRGGTHHTGQAQHLLVDLAQLDAAPAELDLVIGAAAEQQPLGVVDDDVARAVGAVPAQGGHRGVLLGVLLGIEVAGEPHPADDQLPGLSRRHGVPLRIDHREIPAVQRQADPHRRRAVEDRTAGDHRRLRGAVGVPHLAPGRLQAGGELGRAGLTAHDQQPHLGQGAVRPEGDEGGHGGDHGDAVGLQPGADVHARAHQGTGRRHQACAVGPGQPHLLTARVEGDREPGHHPVPGRDRCLLQEHPGLRLHEGGSAAVGDRDPLGLARRAGGEDDPGVIVRLDLALRGGGGGAAGLRHGDHQVVAHHRGRC